MQFALVLISFLIPNCLVAVDDKPGFRETGMLIYDALVQGEPVRCLVDTGINFGGTVDPSVCKLKVPRDSKLINIQTSTSRVERSIIDNVSIAFNGGPTAVVSVDAADLSPLHQVLGQEIGAIVGIDGLRDLVLTIRGGEANFVKSMPRMYIRPDVSPILYSNRSRAELPVRLPARGTHNFILDTGCNLCLVITDDLAQSLVRSRRAVYSIQQVSVNLEGNHTDREIIVKDIDVSGVVFQNVPATIGRFNCIGMGLMTQLNMAVDFRKQRIYIDPMSSSPVSEFPLNATGIQFLYVSNKAIRVGAVRKDSPGSKADVQPRDEVLSIDGKTPADLSLNELMKIVSREGQTIRIELRRSGLVYGVDLTMKRNFEYPPKWAERPGEESEFLEFLEKTELTEKESK